jgi:hypothetical protein
MAPGTDAVSRYPSEKEWATWSGTSFATPQVAAALVGAVPPDVARGPAIGAC